jgi:WD40 repeat protein
MTERTRMTRRGFLACAGVVGQVWGQDRLPAATEGKKLNFKLLREYRNSALLDLASDGRKLALFRTRHPDLKFTARPGLILESKQDRLDDGLEFVDIASGAVLQSAKLRSLAFSGGFFAEGNSFYVETWPFRFNNWAAKQCAVVQLASGQMEENVLPARSGGVSVIYHPLSARTVLGDEANFDTKTKVRELALVLAKWPNFVETTRVPIPHDENREWSWGTEVTVSSDRKRAMYCADQSIVALNTDDLGVLWAHQIEAELFARRIVVSSQGDHVAVAENDTAFIAFQKNFRIEVFDGRKGDLRAQLRVNGYGGIGISPDGKWLSVSQQKRIGGRVEPTVEIYDIESGNMVGSVVHRQILVDQQSLHGDLASQFTADGKYLVTSGLDTRIWTLN